MSTHEDEVLGWRESRVARLIGPDGWFTVVGLAWLHGGENSVGSDPESRVLLSRGPSRAGSITVQGGTIDATFEPEVAVTYDGKFVVVLNLQNNSQKNPTL